MNTARQGALFGIGAAVLFGLTTPVAKLLLAHAGPVTLAALLYLGGGLGVSLLRAGRASGEAPLRGGDYATAGWVLALGGVAAPVLMLFGLQATSAAAASLLLNLEGPLTVLVAAVVFREHLGLGAGLAVALVLGGTFVLGYAPDAHGASNPWAAAALAGACLCWAVDNNLTQRLSLKDPAVIVQIKTLGAGVVNLGLAWFAGEALPPLWAVAAALAAGFLGYGVSILLDTYALRALGAAREAAFFATAPFVGVAGSFVLLGERLGAREGAAFALMATGVVLLLRERHEHLHAHEPLEHEHLHVHDEHHQHAHDGPVTEPHSHRHRHERLVHSHLHVPDVHHRHGHSKSRKGEV